MTPEQFCAWLKGFMDSTDCFGKPNIYLTAEQFQTVKQQLNKTVDKMNQLPSGWWMQQYGQPPESPFMEKPITVETPPNHCRSYEPHNNY